MHYFAGIFDAEGWVSLLKRGNFIIGLELAHEQTAQSLQENFGGTIYKPTRKDKKQVYSWRICTNNEVALQFIDRVAPQCIVKKSQLILLKTYLNQTRLERRQSRPDFTHAMAELKKPVFHTRDQLIVPQTTQPDDNFFKWFAGFMDGDGNFCIYEYEQKNKRRTFDSYIGIFNIFGEPIKYVNERIKGSISNLKGSNFIVWKWVCNQANSEIVCNALWPHLVVKKEQCRLVSDYLKIHQTKIRGIDHSDTNVGLIRDIIKQLKHHNSL